MTSEVKHNTMSLQISEKTSPIVEPRPKVLISGVIIMVDTAKRKLERL